MLVLFEFQVINNRFKMLHPACSDNLNGETKVHSCLMVPIQSLVSVLHACAKGEICHGVSTAAAALVARGIAAGGDRNLFTTQHWPRPRCLPRFSQALATAMRKASANEGLLQTNKAHEHGGTVLLQDTCLAYNELCHRENQFHI